MLLHPTMQSRLIKRLTDSIEAFAELGTTIQTVHGPLTHIDRGGSVLAVAHLDFVRWHTPRFSRRGNTVYCGQLDDRLGAWIALDLLPSLGVTVDVLLTDSEEIGQSTAQYFDPPKDYNWLVQFDRSGTDVVMYEYDCPETVAIAESFGFQTGFGSFTDICWLEHLDIAGWNIGTGYYRQHTDDCHAILSETLAQVRRFVPWWDEMKDTRIAAPKREPKRYGRGTGGGGGNPYGSLSHDWEGEGYRLLDDETYCPDCGEYGTDDYTCTGCGAAYCFCENCGETLGNQDWECIACGVERRDVSVNEFVNRLARDPEHVPIETIADWETLEETWGQ